METKSEAGGHSFKVVDSLKKLLLHEASSEKSLNSEDVCSLFVELTKSVSSIAHKPNSSHVTSQAMEILVHACSNQNHRIRGAASENLKKLIKDLMGTHFSRIQQDLFHELKKNGESRSVCVALDCFSSLFSHTRPSKCGTYAQNLVPVLLRLISRQEESVHEGLLEALSKILPTLVPFMSIVNIKAIANGILSHLVNSPPSYRRMASSSLAGLVNFSKSSHVLMKWLTEQLFDLGCKPNATSELINGVLMTLQQLVQLDDVPVPLLKHAYCYAVSCLVYGDINITVSAMECLNQLLIRTDDEFILWLTSSQSGYQRVKKFWSDKIHSDNVSDATSPDEDLDSPCDNYFEFEKYSNGDQSSELNSQEKFPTSSTVSDIYCMALESECNRPLENLIEYIILKVLSSRRVSTQSLGLTCITCAVAINPSFIESLEFITTFLEARDPKLRSSVAKLLATLIHSQLCFHHGSFSDCHSVVSTAYNYFIDFFEDDTPVVLKSVCEALRICLPMLSLSTEPNRVVDILHKLLPLCESSYWLTKVELLQTLGCLDFSVLAIFDRKITETILTSVVFQLVGDSDYRVRSAACKCLVSLASSLTLDGNALSAHVLINSEKFFSYLSSTNIELSFAGISDALVKQITLSPIGLDHILWFLLENLSSSTDLTLQNGCLEALHVLSIHYPPASLPAQWGCLNPPFTIMEIVFQLMESSRLAWGIQAHSDLLELGSSIFLSCGLAIIHHLEVTDTVWKVINQKTVLDCANTFLSHSVKLLSIFVHIIEEREPEIREKKIQIGLKKQGTVDVSPGKAKPAQLLQESLNIKPPIVPKDGLGCFANLPHFMKLYDACKAAYTNFQVSLAPVGTDKFSRLLQICHNCLAIILEVALANDIGKHVEEILLYTSFTIKIDPSGALLCVQQLLNSLFGMNTSAQHTHLYSPFMLSLDFSIGSSQFVHSDRSIYSLAVMDPIAMMMNWLEACSVTTATLPTETSSEGKRRLSLIHTKKALTMKPVNSASEIKDYITYFEPMVVYALAHFPYTSSLLLQQRVLFLVVQLLHLKVRYDLLDCNHSFFESVKKLIVLMETGMVKGGEALVPHIFQFLVLLASDQSKLVSIPEVIQMCDGVMASGHNVKTFAIPALQPLVLHLFVRSTRLSSDLDIQREVALNMLLRLVEHSKVIVLLTQVLDSYKRKNSRWEEVSNKIYAALLPRLGKLQVVMDTKDSLVALYQLFVSMSPNIINIQGMMAALLKQTVITSSKHLLRWLAIVCIVLKLMGSIISESSLSHISSLHLDVPQFKCPLISVDKPNVLTTVDDKLSQFAWFIRGIILLAADTLYKVSMLGYGEEYELLPILIANMFIMLQIILPGKYLKLKQAFLTLPDYSELTQSFLQLATFHPLLTLHYVNLSLLVNPSSDWIAELIRNKSSSSSSMVMQHGAILSVCYNYNDDLKNLVVSIAKSPALRIHSEMNVQVFLRHIQSNTDILSYIFDQLKVTEVKSSSQLLQYLNIAKNILSPQSVKYLCAEMIPHPLSVIWQAAVVVATNLIDDDSVVISPQFAEELLESVGSFKSRCPELLIRLNSLCGRSTLGLYSSENSVENQVFPSFDKEWCIEMVGNICNSAGPSQDNHMCTRVLSVMEMNDIRAVFDKVELPLSLLENCIVDGIQLSLNMKNAYSESVQDYGLSNASKDHVHPLLEVSVQRLLIILKRNPLNCDLTHCLIRLLAASHQIPNESLLDAESLSLLGDFCLHSFKTGCDRSDPLLIQASIDCCSLALHLPEVQEEISQEWANEAVACLCSLMKKVYPNKLSKAELESKSSSHIDLKSTQDHLLMILNVLLNRKLVPTPHTLHNPLKQFAFTLCRLPLWHGLLITPPALKGEGVVSYKVLDEALKESEVLLEYMQRCNSLGWLTRFQFEERWMQLLGVINQPIPREDCNHEEYLAYSLNVCAGLQAITSLLLGTTLRPHMGDPTSSVPMSVHRNNEMLFLGSRPGRKLANIRQRLELEIILECGARTDLYSYYQSPLLNHYSSSLYPPLYARNVEKEVGKTVVGYGQMPLSSLWSVMFKQLPSGYHSESEEIDVKSCILSLVDLYVHWLIQPIPTPLLTYVLQSIILLSDLFAVSDQFKWMLDTLLNLYENHPHEDSFTTSLIAVGILKSVAVLKSEVKDPERIVKIVEKLLMSDVMVQTACIRGALYLSEDSSSVVMSLCISLFAKYIVACFQNIQSYTEEHLMILWSLTVKIITDHSQHLKDQNFSSNILELTTSLLMNQNISTAFFHSITFGLELIVLNFSLSNREKETVISAASNRFIKSDQSKSLAALSLLLSCMYTGEEASVASGFAEPSSDPMETAIQAREQVNNLMEKLRHGPEISINFIVTILPQVIIDFLPPMEVLQTVVTDFVSPHQSRPKLSASVMAECFSFLIKNGHQAILVEWIILSLESFVQQEPEAKAVWSITCLLLAAFTNDTYRSLFSLVCHWKKLTDSQALQLLCLAAKEFFNQCNEQEQEVMMNKFRTSKYPSLVQVAQYCSV